MPRTPLGADASLSLHRARLVVNHAGSIQVMPKSRGMWLRATRLGQPLVHHMANFTASSNRASAQRCERYRWGEVNVNTLQRTLAIPQLRFKPVNVKRPREARNSGGVPT